MTVFSVETSHIDCEAFVGSHDENPFEAEITYHDHKLESRELKVFVYI